MNSHINGIHHITAIAGDPQANYDFYAQKLGLRLLKKTVNFDDPFTYHLYYGDKNGNPGTILTFFPWGDSAVNGRTGSGQISTISFSIIPQSIEYWLKRLLDFGLQVSGPFKRFDETVILLSDHDNIELELVASAVEKRTGWNNGDIPGIHSIRGFFGAAVPLNDFSSTERFLTKVMGFKKVNEENGRIRFENNSGGPSSYYDILKSSDSPPGKIGRGSVHHIAWRTPDDSSQLEVRESLVSNNFHVTPVVDRNYFHSIYFREPGNVLFEIATDTPGFTVDESIETLGTDLKLPPWYENDRQNIESKLPGLITSKYSYD